MPSDLPPPSRAAPRRRDCTDPVVANAQKTVLLALLALVILVVAVGTMALIAMYHAGHGAAV
jgi:hypothetical protein